MFDLMNKIDVKRAISPAAAVTDNTPFVSQIIDTSGYEALVFIINLGSIADADATFVVLIEDGDASNLSDAAAVDDQYLTGTEALATFLFSSDNALRKIGYVGSKRYVRMTITPAANTGNIFLSAIAILGGARYAPTANPPV
jgi:hypothetical protein